MSAFRVVLFAGRLLGSSGSLARSSAGLSAARNRLYNERLPRIPSAQGVLAQAPARFCTTEEKKTPWTDVTYDELKALIKSGHVQLIDVREPEEIENTGLLPGAINIPLGRLHQALMIMSDQAFSNKYSTPQPKKWDNNIMLYGNDPKSVRARASLELLHKWGFIKARHYIGGYAEWNEKQQG